MTDHPTDRVEEALGGLVRPLLATDRVAAIRAAGASALGQRPEPFLRLETSTAAVFAVLLLAWGLQGSLSLLV